VTHVRVIASAAFPEILLGRLDADLLDAHAHQNLNLLVSPPDHGREMAETARLCADRHPHRISHDLRVPVPRSL